MNGLFSAIKTHAARSRRRVAIGIVKEPTPMLVSGLEEARKFADILVVGTAVSGFESIYAETDKEASNCLMNLIQRRDVEAIVRGQLYYSDYHESMRQHFGFKRDVMCPTLIRDQCRNEWFITPVVHHDDSSVAGRCYLASQAAVLCRKLGIQPVIGVLAPDEEQEKGYMTKVDNGLMEAKIIVQKLKSSGLKAEFFPLRIDSAACKSNIVVPMDGIIGNFVCRALTYLGKCELVGGFSLTNRFVSIDTSRLSDPFLFAIEGAVAMVNLGGMSIEEYDL